ncbi:uncharacterized protein FOMMEDRAFT_89899 [Fomitiporia mediterranea MF3/22]|uniref:uncharacterized protein n=1 Tax=Fomitiporia mediterranea (strain MF3/22) TaxID=694068 RepID=UPI00044085FC|nr:uncharacterized protein FOMMEDRAFT_89899 [Fomitiporia mediterranea MF3/22]EJD01698.1 hypothetical protein FOMMEDRAFT_89899 [Fomitiporia mediterranea MF3/22]
MATSTQYVLLQYGTDPFNYQFEDSDEQTAFTTSKVVQVPNVVVQLTRHDDWAAQHTQVMGPRSAFLYFGPFNSPGQVAYGNGERVAMSYYLRKKKEGSNSRYFNAQGGKEFKWKSVSSERMELCDALNVYAVWEKAPPNSEHDAQITISYTCLSIVTEILTTLTLNLAAKRLQFW